MMKDILFLKKFPITPGNAVCCCSEQAITVTGEKGVAFHPGCGKFLPPKKEKR